MDHLELLQESIKNTQKTTNRLLREHIRLINTIRNIKEMIANENENISNKEILKKIKFGLESVHDVISIDIPQNNKEVDKNGIQWWECPCCKSKVNLSEELDTLFDEDGEAMFCPEFGVPFYVIKCPNCPSAWNFGVSSMYKY